MDVLSLPFFRTTVLAIVVLAGIHAYLGYHVVRRGVIFVDLALAQMAALGIALGIVFGVHESPAWNYVMRLAMTIVGAACFAWLRNQERRVPLEAFIGIVFATAQAAVFLVLEKSPSGPEHLKETLVGTLYTVDPRHVALTACLYAFIGLVHFLLRRPFFEITNDAEAARRRGRSLFGWDFLFYALFGVVVTSSVEIAGVLLVFGLLVIPAVAGLLATGRAGTALAVGWTFALIASLGGLLASVRFDLPAAPSILVALAICLGLLGFGLRFRRSNGAGTEDVAAESPARVLEPIGDATSDRSRSS